MHPVIAGVLDGKNGIRKERATEKQHRGCFGQRGLPRSIRPGQGGYGAKVRAKLAGLDTVPPPAKWRLFSPVIDTFLKEHLVADLFIHDVLSHQDRELATIASLTNMSGTEGQLLFHFEGAMNTGLTETQIKDFISVLQTTVSKTQAESAEKILTEVLNNRK
jgi:alkylhydroperoxidase/carboxymuconolactone decarboxylase family protein YurZ